VNTSAALVPSPDPPPDSDAPHAQRAPRWGGAAKRRAATAAAAAAAERTLAEAEAEAAEAREMHDDCAAFATPPTSPALAAGAGAAPADALSAELRALAVTLRDAAAAAGSPGAGKEDAAAMVQRLRLILHYLRHLGADALQLRASGAVSHVAPLMQHADEFVASAAREYVRLRAVFAFASALIALL